MTSPTKPMSATTKENVRTALRLFRNSAVAPRPDKINHAMVVDWLDALVQHPAKLPRNIAPLHRPQTFFSILRGQALGRGKAPAGPSGSARTNLCHCPPSGVRIPSAFNAAARPPKDPMPPPRSAEGSYGGDRP